MRTLNNSRSPLRWDNYKKCTLYTDTSVCALNFDLDFKDYEMIAFVMEIYEIDKFEITGIEISKCKFLCND